MAKGVIVLRPWFLDVAIHPNEGRRNQRYLD